LNGAMPEAVGQIIIVPGETRLSIWLINCFLTRFFSSISTRVTEDIFSSLAYFRAKGIRFRETHAPCA